MLTSSALLTDRYELTMIDAARHSGMASRQTVFEVFCRQLPAGRRYGVVAGTGRLLDRIRDFRFEEDELRFLSENKVVDRETIDWLADYKFTGNIHGYREGDLYFAYSPVLTVEATFEQAVVLETIILSVLNFDSAVASAASRMVSAAKGRFLAEMGGRRTNEIAAVAAARAAYIAGFSATSNLEAGRSWGIPTMGTAAHAFTLLHDTEEEAFKAQVATFGPETTLLVDTYDVDAAIRKAVEIAGPKLGAVRLDSGDLVVEVARVRALLDSLGNKNTKITVTNDLDEYSIAALGAAPVDNYGVGTSVVTGSSVPTAGFVYKLVAFEDRDGGWVSVAKRSVHKTNVGGRKQALRSHDATGTATAEKLSAGHVSEKTEGDRELLVPLINGGEIEQQYLGANGTKLARDFHEEAMKALPLKGLSLMRGEAAIPTRFI
ncbi:MAG: hypothetical protein RLZZ400_397 [Actinomycetota bacterium]